MTENPEEQLPIAQERIQKLFQEGIAAGLASDSLRVVDQTKRFSKLMEEGEILVGLGLDRRENVDNMHIRVRRHESGKPYVYIGVPLNMALTIGTGDFTQVVKGTNRFIKAATGALKLHGELQNEINHKRLTTTI